MRYENNQDVFLNEDAISYYLLGVYMSDGTITDNNRKRFELTSKDKSWVESIRDLISPLRPVYKAREVYSRLAISDPDIVSWLVKNGCTPRKSKTLEMPNIPSKYLPDFVRGYFDGDGSVSVCKYKKKKGSKTYCYTKFNAYICSGSEGFITELQKQIPIAGCLSHVSTGGNTLKGKLIPSGNMWRISFGDRTALKFTNWTHYEGHVISMPRKLQKIQEARSYYGVD